MIKKYKIKIEIHDSNLIIIKRFLTTRGVERWLTRFINTGLGKSAEVFSIEIYINDILIDSAIVRD